MRVNRTDNVKEPSQSLDAATRSGKSLSRGHIGRMFMNTFSLSSPDLEFPELLGLDVQQVGDHSTVPKYKGFVEGRQRSSPKFTKQTIDK